MTSGVAGEKLVGLFRNDVSPILSISLHGSPRFHARPGPLSNSRYQHRPKTVILSKRLDVHGNARLGMIQTVPRTLNQERASKSPSVATLVGSGPICSQRDDPVLSNIHLQRRIGFLMGRIDFGKVGGVGESGDQ